MEKNETHLLRCSWGTGARILGDDWGLDVRILGNRSGLLAQQKSAQDDIGRGKGLTDLRKWRRGVELRLYPAASQAVYRASTGACVADFSSPESQISLNQ